MKGVTRRPIRALVWLLRLVSSRDAANAEIGDIYEELDARRAMGRGPRLAAGWINLQVISAITSKMLAAVPRLLRSTGLLLRDAGRGIRAAPGHSLFVVFVLAIGATLGTVTFSIVDAVILRPLPLEHPEQLVGIPTRDQNFKQRITPQLYWHLHDRLQSVEALAARMTLTGTASTIGGVTDEWPIAYASANIFRILRLSPSIGRLWTAEDEQRGNTDVAVLGYGFWRRQLGGDPSILGKTVSLHKRSYEVIGVLSAESDHPELDFLLTPIWIPRVVPRAPSESVLAITARMRPGVTTAQVADEVQRLTGISDWRPEIGLLHDSFVARFRPAMLLALAAAALVVLVACANAATLMLARSAGRVQEMAIRSSLGASRRQVAMVVLAEGLMLSLAATAGALMFSIAGVRVAKTIVETALPGTFRASAIALNGRVLAAAIACAVVTGILCSLVPAWQTSRAPASTLLKDSEAPTATGRRRWRSVFLTAEIGAVVVLLVVSWMFVASLIRVLGVDLGIERANLIAVKPRLAFESTVDNVQQRIESVPGVSAVAVSTGSSPPLVGRAFGGAWHTTKLQRSDASPRAEAGPSIEVLQYRVTPNYFAVLGLRFRRGESWTSDAAAGLPVLVLDERAAGRLFGDEDPIGRDVRSTDPKGIFTVVGIVPHVYARGAEDGERLSAYFPLQSNPARRFAGLLVKTSRSPDETLLAVTEALKPVAPQQKDPFVFLVDDAVRAITATRRFNSGLMSAFGLIGTLIGAAGVFAVMTSFVAQQTREIGVRVALGATPARIQRSVLALAWRHLLAGLVLGVPIAWWLSRGFSTLLFQVTPLDASVYAGVSVLLLAVGFLAAWIPARRAAMIDPIISLRR